MVAGGAGFLGSHSARDYSSVARNPEELSALTLARRVAGILKMKPEIVFKPLPKDDPQVRQPNITRAKQLLGWEPKVSRAEGRRRTLDYFKSRIDIPVAQAS